MSRLFKDDLIVKKEYGMRRLTAWLLALMMLFCLAACTEKDNGQATPGNISTPKPSAPHVSTETSDVSADYSDRLCSYPWLDTYDMCYYRFSPDGTYEHLEDKELTKVIGSGKWSMLSDAEGFLTLRMEPAEGEAFELYELELYEQSIYAHSLTETDYIWLLCDTAEEEA